MLVVLDGVGGLPDPESGLTELESARTPNLDALASRSSLGMLLPVAPGVTAGSGPGHLALFGYDPVEHVIGRGVLSALGVGFELRLGDVAVRLNLATLDEAGRVVDRRAGRPSDEEGRRVVEKVRAALPAGEGLGEGVELFLVHEKDHRVVMVLRGEGLEAAVSDTDPQEVGVAPHPAEALEPGSATTAELFSRFDVRLREVLADEGRINGVLARGFARYEAFPSLEARFRLSGVAVARYPMYRGVSRLVGMDADATPESDEEAVAALEERFGSYDFHFLHFKAPDALGEDGDFAGKVQSLEEIDRLIPRLAALRPSALVVTGDHSTPARMRAHSWHHVPLLIHSDRTRPTGEAFREDVCRTGELGVVRGCDLMSLALAHAGRLAKFGA